MLTCLATIIYETCVNGLKRCTNHVRRLELLRGIFRSRLFPLAPSEEVYQKQDLISLLGAVLTGRHHAGHRSVCALTFTTHNGIRPYQGQMMQYLTY